MTFHKARKKGARVHQEGRVQILNSNSPFAYAEAYKSLRTNLSFVSLNSKCKKLVLTSTIPGEGKTSVAINLATTLAETGNKVMLIDCDLRRPMMHRYLRVSHSVSAGLSTLLTGASKLESSAYHLNDLGFDVLLAGTTPPNPAELLGSTQMEDLLNFLSQNYDYVLCDTPPVSMITDAAVLSRFADGVLMVIRQKYATREEVKAAKRNLETVNAKILGTILNQYDAEQDTMSANRYGYGYGYEYDEKNNSAQGSRR